MPETTTYYLGRIIKAGKLTSDMIISAILNPKTTNYRGNAWSFFDAKSFETRGIKYVYARLSKFNPEGEVVISDPKTKHESVQPEPNLRIASSVFMYIPEVSGIAFTKVYSHIDEQQFRYRFCDIIKTTHNNFFVDCSIKLISDLRTFAEKLMSLDGIYRIQATLYPPNPIFGPLWEPLKRYIENRRSNKMVISEVSSDDVALNTELPKHVKSVAEQTSNEPYIPLDTLPIGDAAILMAADGYGSGLVKGLQHGDMVVVKTSETIKNFDFNKDPSSQELFEIAYDIFKRIEKDRHMEH